MHHITSFWDEKFINFLTRGTALPQTPPPSPPTAPRFSRLRRSTCDPQCSSGVDAHVLSPEISQCFERTLTSIACIIQQPNIVGFCRQQAEAASTSLLVWHTNTNTHTHIDSMIATEIIAYTVVSRLFSLRLRLVMLRTTISNTTML